MKNLNVIFLAFLLLLFGCKKKEDNSSSSAPLLYSAFFQGIVTTTWSGSTPSLITPYSANVFVMKSPVMSLDATIGVNAGDAFVNSTKLKYMGNKYYDTTFTLNLSTQRDFQFNSNDKIPGFTFNNTDDFPKFYVNYNNLVNDTISKAANFSVPLTGLSYADEIECVLLDSVHSVIRTAPKGLSEIVFTPADLSFFTAGTNIHLLIELRKFNVQNINKKFIRFENNNSTSLPVRVKN